MLNRVVLVGRLTKDVDIRNTPNGKAVATFTLAVDRKYKKDEADFIPVVVWGKSAENCAEYIGKGSLVAVDGRIQTRNYEKDGRKVYITEVIADDVRFLDKKRTSSPESEYGTAVEDDDIPF